MDYSKYRKSGELSDLTVNVDQQAFKVHKFPLFVRSDYFKEACASSSSVTLEKFPGGAPTFETIADYFYGKQVNVNYQNAVSVLCALQYLKVNDDDKSHKSLASMSESVLFETTHTAKARRDYSQPLELLDQAIHSSDYAEKNGIHQKLIDSFADTLSYTLKTSSPYDMYGGYQGSKETPAKSALTKNQSNTLNHLPLNWFLELIKSSQKFGLSPDVLAKIVKDYLDFNTGFNPNFNKEPPKPSAKSTKPNELIAIAADILKVEKKLNQIADDDDDDDDKKTETKKEEKEKENLVKIIADVLKKEPNSSQDKENDSDKEKEDDSSSVKDNLVKMMSDILSINSKPKHQKKNLNNDEKLKVVNDVSKLLKELRLDLPFPMSWLMLYLDNLKNMGADDDVQSIFNKWSWNALQEPGNNADTNLAAVPPSIMAQLAKDLAKDSTDSPFEAERKTAKRFADFKFVDLIDSYLNELENQDKLTPQVFIDLVSAVPKEKRNSYDSLMHTLLDLLKRDKKIDPETRDKLLDLIDFNKLTEKTLEECKDSDLIPPKYIAEAALALCAKLRKQLEESKLMDRSNYYDRSRPYYSPSRAAADLEIPSSYTPSYTPKYYSPAGPNIDTKYQGAPPRTHSIDPPYSRPQYQRTSTSPIHDSSRNNLKGIYPIPVSRSSVEGSSAVPIKPGRDRSQTQPVSNYYEHTSECCVDDDKTENEDYYYSASYSFSTVY